MYPNELKYHQNHMWMKITDDEAYIGITHYAQEQLGEILFVELPEIGDEISQGSDFGVVESSKVASDLVAPLSGEVLEVNEKLDDEPEFVNEEPYNAWIAKIKISNSSEIEKLLTSKEYENSLE